MDNLSTTEKLKAMRMSVMAKVFAQQLSDPAYKTLSFEERFAFLVDEEWNSRQKNKLLRNIRNAHFANPNASIENIEYYEDRKLDRTELFRLATCTYITEGRNIILKGASGSGKTYIACALGNAACRKFKTVRYIRLPELLEELRLARAADKFETTIHAYQKVNLLILDEWLIRRLTAQESYDLLEIVNSRSRHDSPVFGATIFCTQYDTDDWYERINPDSDDHSTISDAIMDRIIHNSYGVLIEGKRSMRERHGLKANGE